MSNIGAQAQIRANSISPGQLKDLYIESLVQLYPSLAQDQLEQRISDNMLCPHIVELPKIALEQAKEFAATIFELRSSQHFLNHYLPQFEGPCAVSNNSILMSYDYHWTGSDLKLIEINTNAAFFALGELLYRAIGLNRPLGEQGLEALKNDILNELKLTGRSNSISPRIAIIDDHPSTQRLYLEFLVFKEIFKSWGWTCEILDYRELSTNPDFDFIYNRYTDFLLNDPSSSTLREIWQSNQACLSPQPLEYFLLAEKNRMTEWQEPQLQEIMQMSDQQKKIISRHVPKTLDCQKTSADDLWSQRKNLFFKPKRAFGSKQSYKGGSIAKRVFEEILAGEFVAQEYVPPSEVTIKTENGPQNFKYDLRFYAYQGKVESVIARVYQGQLTNLKTPWGGFAPVEFI
jgi:hypothetical protein